MYDFMCSTGSPALALHFFTTAIGGFVDHADQPLPILTPLRLCLSLPRSVSEVSI